MFRHFLLITLRGFLKHKMSFIINLIGLSTGLASVLIIYTWVQKEMNVDKFHELDERLYTVMVNSDRGSTITTGNGTPPLLGPELMRAYPEVVDHAYMSNGFFDTEGVLAFDQTELLGKGLFASTNLFEVCTYPLVEGDPRTVLEGKNNVVLSESLAGKLFGSVAQSVGRSISIKVNNWRVDDVFLVTGVFQDPPENATRQFEFVLQYEWMIDGDQNAGLWPGGYAETLIVLDEKANKEEVDEKIAGFLKDKSPSRESATLFLQQYSDQYLNGNYVDGRVEGGRMVYVRLFSAVALFILLIACVNYMNLATAQATLKQKEIGVKKTMGFSQQLLLKQFLGESIFLTFLGLFFAIILVYALLPGFNVLTNSKLELLFNLESITVFLGIALITGLLGGAYPAIYLSRLRPSLVLHQNRSAASRAQWVRKGLVVFQFALAAVFILCVQVINAQLEFSQQKYLGYDRDQVISFEGRLFENEQGPDAFIQEIAKIPGVLSVSNMSGSFLWGQDNQGGYSWRGIEEDREKSFKSPRIGYNVVETLGIHVLQGRSFSKELNDDFTKIIVNESAVRYMELTDPVGQVIQYGDTQREIIGVVRDFNYGSIHHAVEPLIFRFRTVGNNFLLKIREGANQQVLSELEAVYKSFFPLHDFDYAFLDDAYEALYASENSVAVLVKWFSVLAIIISCLGLFGMASFIIARRKKEIGIRKVHGSSEWKIMSLLSRNFLLLVCIGILLALPLGMFVVDRWLDSFAYRIALHPGFFVATALITMMTSWLTVSIETYKAASMNPVECLQAE